MKIIPSFLTGTIVVIIDIDGCLRGIITKVEVMKKKKKLMHHHNAFFVFMIWDIKPSKSNSEKIYRKLTMMTL